MRTCEGCGEDLPAVAAFCPVCGEPTGAEVPDPAVFTQPRKGVLCAGCSQRTVSEGDYCMWCGFRLDSLGEGTDPRVGRVSDQVTEVGGVPLTTAVKEAPSRGGVNKPLFLAIIAGLVVALVVVVLMLVAAQKRAQNLAAAAGEATRAQPELSPAELRFAEALDYLEQQRFEEAEVMLRATLLADPRHPEARDKLERVQEQARVALSARRARDDLEGQDYDGALQSVNQIPTESLERDPELVKLRARVRDAYRKHHQDQAALAEKLGDFQSAETHLLAVLAVEADDTLARAKLDELRTRLTQSPRKGAAARASPQELAELRPELTVEQLSQKASEAVQRGNYLLAIESLQRAIKLKPDDPDLVRLLGNVHAVEGNRGEALRQYRRYLELCPNCVYTQTVRSTVRAFEELGTR